MSNLRTASALASLAIVSGIMVPTVSLDSPSTFPTLNSPSPPVPTLMCDVSTGRKRKRRSKAQQKAAKAKAVAKRGKK